MNYLPYELQFKILLELEYPEINQLCQTNKSYYYFCKDDYLWQQLMLRDFPDLLESKPIDEDFKQFYIENYYWSQKLLRDYSSLYQSRDYGKNYNEYYLDIDYYIEEEAIDLVADINIVLSSTMIPELELTIEMMDKILVLFKLDETLSNYEFTKRIYHSLGLNMYHSEIEPTFDEFDIDILIQRYVETVNNFLKYQ